MSSQTVRTVSVGLLLLILGGVIGYRAGAGEVGFSRLLGTISNPQKLLNTQKPSKIQSDIDFSEFWEVWYRLESQYLDPEKLVAQEMMYGAIQGMTNALGDPYTVYLPPQEQQRSVEDLQGEFDGVGIQLGYISNTLAVVSPLKDHPAEKAGIIAGDLILRIKDEQAGVDRDTLDISLPEAVNLIRGKRGTPVTLTIVRGEDPPVEKTLIRDTILVPSVELSFEEQDGKRVAHLILSRFGEKTEAEWGAAVVEILREFRQNNISGIVLDMRNNPGGYLQGSIDIASEFIPDGTVVIQEGRNESKPYSVTRQARLVGIPVNVLVNKGSASASEIVAGALRDRKGAKLIGENTFGKGTVQDAQDDFKSGAGLHITIGRWLLPSGDWIHEKGLEVDVVAADNPETADLDEALQVAIEQL